MIDKIDEYECLNRACRIKFTGRRKPQQCPKCRYLYIKWVTYFKEHPELEKEFDKSDGVWK